MKNLQKILRKLPPIFYIAFSFALVCTMIIALVNSQLRMYLSDYEDSTVENYMEQTLLRFQTGKVDAIVDILAVEPTPFTNRQDQVEYVKSVLGEDRSQIRYFGGELVNNKHQYEFAIPGKRGIKVEVSTHVGDGILPLSTYSLTGKPFDYSEITIYAPKNVGILVNGVEVESHFLQKETRVIDGFAAIKDKELIPTLVSYKVYGLLSRKIVEAKDGECFVEQNGDEFTVLQKADSKLSLEIEDMAKKASVSYARFISNDGTFSDFAQYLQKDTAYYKSVVGFDTSWYVSHSGVAVLDLNATKTIKHSDELYSTEVTFTYQVSQGKKKHDYENRYIISIVKKDGGYKIVNLLSL